MQEHWATALKTLTLTLDEVVHIRSVLTKAELEGLPLDGDLKDDVAKGKVSSLEHSGCVVFSVNFYYYVRREFVPFSRIENN